jgi:diguanylate cyclase (GGDEF)-like protein
MQVSARLEPARSGQRPRILVADDEADILELVAGRLEQLGYEVLRATDGEQALRLALTEAPEIAILDVSMPGLDGLQVTRRLRESDKADQVAVILLTARVSDADVARGFDVGAEDYIKKPFSLRELTEAVTRKRAERALQRSEAETRRLAGEQAALRRTATAVASEAAPRTIFALAAEEAARVLGADLSAVVRFDEGAQWGRVVGSWVGTSPRPPRPGALIGLETQPPASSAAARDRVPTAQSDEEEHVRALAARLMAGSGCRQAVAVPVRLGRRLWGALAVGSARPDGLEPDCELRLAQFASLVSQAVANAETRAELATLAAVDHLTGLPNQRAFQERLDKEVGRARRHESALSLIVFDLDHFKRVNDLHGHDVGNQVLAEAARRLAGLIRSGEMVARVGGEEFAWILPETNAEGALAAAERARRALSEQPFEVVGRLTVSAGVCELGGRAEDAGALFRLADMALYWAKEAGRDTARRYSPQGGETVGEDRREREREREQALRALAEEADARDPLGRGHSGRVARIVERLARAAGWPDEQASLLGEAGLVHDVGMIAVADEWLQKPGPLSAAERKQIEAHPALGAQILAGIVTSEQAAWVRHHHERPDGRGYPDGLSGAAIPHGARLLALAEAWDAMTSDRPWQPPLEPERALEECRRQAGRQFAPEAVAVLERLWEEEGADWLSRDGHREPADLAVLAGTTPGRDPEGS